MQSRKGFTLIELLVVIAIIAILAAILFPVFAKARDAARKTACLSNMKQIGTGLMMYAQDFDETLPGIPLGSCNTCWPWAAWPGTHDWNGIFEFAIQPYVKNMQITQCPSGTEGDNRWSGRNGSSYCYNEYIYNFNNGWSKLSAIGNAGVGVSKVSVVVECYTSGIYNDWTTEGPTLPDGTADGMTRIRYHQWGPWQSNHEGSNITYADGHAKFISKDGIRSQRLQGVNKQTPVVYPGAAENN